MTTGGSIRTSRTRQTTPTRRRPGESGERSSRGGVWWKPTRNEIRPAHTNQFSDAASAVNASPPLTRTFHKNETTPNGSGLTAVQRLAAPAAVELAHWEQVQRGHEKAGPRGIGHRVREEHVARRDRPEA